MVRRRRRRRRSLMNEVGSDTVPNGRRRVDSKCKQ
jgi:hypothetical protein